MLTLICAGLLLVVPATTVRAQGGDSMGTGGKHKIVGRIHFPSGRRSDATAVKVTLDSSSSERLVLMADLNGSFVFNSLAPGSYTITVEAGEDYEVGRERVVIESFGIRNRNIPSAEMARANVARTFNVMITLQLKRTFVAKASVINAALATVPNTARDAYLKALEFVRTGQTKQAVEGLKTAVSLHPQFPLALNELGVQYLRLGEVNKAAEVLSAAVRYAPDDFTPRLNYGVALLNQRKFAESEEHLRLAVSKNSAAPTAHMYLGISLAIQRKLDEANRELELAISSRSAEVALAHRYLGGVYLERRDYKRAAEQLETYLKLVPKAADSELLHQKIKELRTKS
ncbi:MAG TPA: tetratricopeptide repeat protein [Pyrinomonadaceae bacterium]|nr:tetratricopeptide repeat protein [Pyrinomonadaceae bacterium]